MVTKRRRSTVLALLVLALGVGVAAGCGGDDDEAAAPPTATETETDATEPGTTEPGDGDAAEGASVYTSNCQTCHGSEGEGGIGPNLQTSSAAEDLTRVVRQVENGGGSMPPFRDTLSDEEIQAVSEYVVNELAPRG